MLYAKQSQMKFFEKTQKFHLYSFKKVVYYN